MEFNNLYNEIIENIQEISNKFLNMSYSDFSDLSYIDLKNIKLIPFNNTINESDENLYQTKYFIEFFELIKSVKYSKPISYNNDLYHIFQPIFSRNVKFNKEKNIFLLKFPFNKYSEFIKCLTNAKLNKNVKIDIETCQAIYNKIIFPNWIKLGGLYIPTSTKTSFMFINTLQYNEDTVKHELIHYFQDNNGISILNNIKPVDIINMYGLCRNVLPNNLFNPEEYVPYANEICYVFEKNGIYTDKQSKNILFKFSNGIFSNENAIINYINKCQQLPEYNWFIQLKKQDFIEFYMLCFIYNKEKADIMMYIIENYFKKESE